MSKQHSHKVHKYQRIKRKPSNTFIYKCTLPNCSHYVEEFLVWNKITICHNCGEEFVLTKRKNNQAYPKCLDCTVTHKKNLDKEVGNKVDKLMESLE